MKPDLTIDPPCSRWLELLSRRPDGVVLGRSLDQWRQQSRRELGLDGDRPIIATGHQTLLWHPGILSKFLAVDAFSQRHDLGRANLIVDQHAEGFGSFDIPIRRGDGALGVRRIELCRPRKDVPMVRHESFTPPPLPEPLMAALPSADAGARAIVEAIAAHRNAPNAAMQMARALNDLMKPWCREIHGACSSDLITTSLAKAMLQEMAREPRRCAECYNRAVRSLPEVGIPTLAVRDNSVELPLWRIQQDGQRIRAYANDVAEAISSGDQPRQSKIQNPDRRSAVAESKVDLLPRALFMTALVRLCMCDLFIHGTGGANYDRAMERWIRDWLGVEVSSIAVVTANLRLPLGFDEDQPDIQAIASELRWQWHDASGGGEARRPGPVKRRMLEAIEAAPRDSAQRRAAFLHMHARLAELREAQRPRLERAREQLEHARRRAADAAVARRRDWAFPFYSTEAIDALARAVRDLTAAEAPRGARP